MTIFDYFTAQVIAVYYNERTENLPPFLGEFYFPNDKQLSLDLSWIKGANSTPVALKHSNFDADPTYRDFGGFEKISTEMPFFREGYLLKEKDRQEMLRIMASTNFAGLSTFLGRIYNDIADLVLSASVTREIMRMQLLTTGKIVMNADGVALNYDYSLDAKQKVTPTVKWNVPATATPLTDLAKWKKDAERRTGETISDVLMNSTTFDYIMNAQSTKDLFKDFLLGTPDENNVTDYIRRKYTLNIVLYDKQYKLKAKDAQARYYIPDGVVVMLPHVQLGNTMFGTTPAEADLLYSNVSNVEIVDTGVAISTTTKSEPVKVETLVSQIVLPTFESAELLTIANVL